MKLKRKEERTEVGLEECVAAKDERAACQYSMNQIV